MQCEIRLLAPGFAPSKPYLGETISVDRTAPLSTTPSPSLRLTFDRQSSVGMNWLGGGASSDEAIIPAPGGPNQGVIPMDQIVQGFVEPTLRFELRTCCLRSRSA